MSAIRLVTIISEACGRTEHEASVSRQLWQLSSTPAINDDKEIGQQVKCGTYKLDVSHFDAHNAGDNQFCKELSQQQQPL